MLMPLMIAVEFMFQLALGPAFLIVLVSVLVLALRFPLYKKFAAGFLALFGLGAAVASCLLLFSSGFLIGFGTLLIGLFLGLFRGPQKGPSFKRLNSPILRKGVYAFFACILVLCSLLIGARLTGIVREDHLISYPAWLHGDEPNVVLKGTVTSFALDQEVKFYFSYIVLPAYVIFNVTEIVWSNSSYRGWVINYEDLLNKDQIIFYEKPIVPSLSVGQQFEFKGVYCVWVEDSVYSYKLVVSPDISGSYLNPV